MHALSRMLALAALLAVVGCSAPAPEQDEESAKALGRDTDQTVFDDMIQTQDKARAVEGITLGHKGELDQALERSESEAADTDE